jgi:hypothetical protein
MKAKTAVITLILTLAALMIAGASDITPVDNFNLRGKYNITNARFVNGTEANFTNFAGDGSLLRNVNVTNMEKDPLWTENFSGYNKTAWDIAHAYVTNHTYVYVSGDTMTGTLVVPNINVSTRAYFGASALTLGTSEANSYLWFYDGGSPTGQGLEWADGANEFELSTKLVVVGDIAALGDFYTSTTGRDLWLGALAQASAPFRAYANGTLNFVGGGCSGNFSTPAINLNGFTNKSISYNDNCTVIRGPTSTLKVC